MSLEGAPARPSGVPRDGGEQLSGTSEVRGAAGSTVGVPGSVALLLESRSTVLADLDDSERLLVLSDLTGTRQLHELVPGGAMRRLTALGEPVGAACYVPGSRTAAIEVDRGGDERHQLYLVVLDRAAPARDVDELVALTSDPRYGHHLAGISPDGTLLAYTSNRRNGVDFDLWVVPLAGEPGALTAAGTADHRLLHAGGGWCQPSTGFSPDGRLVAVGRPGGRPLDEDLLIVEVATGDVKVVLRHPEEAATVAAPAWTGPRACFVSSDVGRDHAAVVRCDLDAGTSDPFPVGGHFGAGSAFDARPITSRDGSTLLVVENHDGESRLALFDAATGDRHADVPLHEPGVVEGVRIPGPRLSPDGGRVYYTLSSPRLAGDVWCFDRRSGQSRRLTTSPAPLPAGQLAVPGHERVASFDGEQIPLFVFRPSSPHSAASSQPPAASSRPPSSTRDAGGPSEDGRPVAPPVVVVIHGGPESQATLRFDPIVQGLVAEGFAVVVPNVRGSTGYGKRFASLDDTTRRPDSVRDLAAIHAWLAGAGFDPRRAALWGGSYGGYMVLAGLAFQPELWAAGVDIVGISDLVTFLTNTSAYRRAAREREYGSLERDGAFLAEASPLRRAERIAAPLFVIHGRNDPRVPLGEAEQLVAALRRRGVRCELLVYDDEGHGLARLANRLDAYPRAVAFLDEVLRPA
jgi:dipeptidyl aminopeptidase/acylaminoacyl peptidase